MVSEQKSHIPESELCPHGKLHGICQECLKTTEGQSRQEDISLQAKEIGSQTAQELWNELENEGLDPKEYIYDVVMVLGAGFKEAIEGEPGEKNKGWMLNKESKIRLVAAAQLYLEGRTRVLCLTGGKGVSEQWKDHPSLADLGKKYLIEKFNIPEKDIIIENQSDASHGNLAYGLRELYKSNIPVTKFAMISSGYHLRRADRMANEMGIEASLIPAENELLNRSNHYGRFVREWKKYVDDHGMVGNEDAKLDDQEYWDKRRRLFTTPLDEDVPAVDISADVAATAKRLAESGAEGVQTDAF